MGISQRRLRQKEEVRTSILDTAFNIVREDGWQALSIRKIADAIDYSVPVIYDHFENKECILITFAREGFAELGKRMQEAASKHEDPAMQLKAMADAYWYFAFDSKEYYQVMFNLGISCSEEEQCLPEKVIFRNLITDTIDVILKKYNRTDINSCLKTHTYWSVLHGLVSIKMMRNSDISDELNKMVIDDAIDGFIKNLSR